MYRLGFIITFLMMTLATTEAKPEAAVRVPLFITPLKSLPQPLDKTSDYYREAKRQEFFSKVTVWDVWQSTNISLHRLLNSTVFHIINSANKLYDDGILKPTELRVHNCKKYCYVIDLDEISSVTRHDKSYLSGKTSPAITLGQLNEAVVNTMETVFCFSMRQSEESLGISSVNVTEKEWGYFVSVIVKYAIKCRADILVVETSELAELVRRNESLLLAYDLEKLKSDFISAYENILLKKDVFEKQEIGITVGMENKEGSTDLNGGDWLSEPLFNYTALATNFTIRDMEILYRWHSSQLYALEFIVMQSYRSCQGLSLERTMYNISQIIMAVSYQVISDCPVSLVLARSIDKVQNISVRFGNIFNESVLGIFMKASGISSWFEVANILDIGYDTGIYLDAPTIEEIVNNKNVNRKHIESSSVPQIIAEYLLDGEMDILVEEHQSIFRLMLSTYDLTVKELLDAAGISDVQLDLMTIPSAHRLLLETIIRRYQIKNFTSMIYYPDSFQLDLNMAATLPSSEWKWIVAAAIQASFNQTSVAFFGNLQQIHDGIRVVPLWDGFQSISVISKLSYRSYNITELALCLLNRTITSIYSMSFAEYHRFYNYTLVDQMRKKIAFETKSLRAILAARGITLINIKDESLLRTIYQGVGFKRFEIECLYGWSTLSALSGGITWHEVGETRLCHPLEDRSLFNISMDLKQAPVITCNGDECSSSPCHINALCLGNNRTLKCECNLGFSGDGYISCTDRDECLSSPCHVNAVCQNIVGSYSCLCQNGYTGDGKDCTDTDECLALPCHSSAICQNTMGTYVCCCQNGFTGDGKSCTADVSSNSSSGSGSIVIIASVIGGLVLLLAVAFLLAYGLYRRNSRKNVIQKRVQHQNYDMQNSAYEPEFPSRRQPAAYSDGSYEMTDDYAQLDNSRRLPFDENYEALTFKGRNKGSGFDDDDYTKLSEQREQADGSYATLNLTSKRENGATTTDNTASHSQNQDSNEPIYVELP